MRSLLFVLALASCFNPPIGRPTAGSTTGTATTGAMSTTSGSLPTSGGPAVSTGEPAVSSSTGAPTRPVPELDMPGPPECPARQGAAWAACGDGATCEPGAECWLASAGWFCAPACVTDSDCDVTCALSTEVACEAGRCTAKCVTSDECAPGSLCDAGRCVWSSDCGPSLGDPFQPCAMSMCTLGACTQSDICAPACPCPEQVVVCGVDLGEPECGAGDLCYLPCETDTDCHAGMRCSPALTCEWL